MTSSQDEKNNNVRESKLPLLNNNNMNQNSKKTTTSPSVEPLLLALIYSSFPPFRFQVDSFDVSSMKIDNNNNYSSDINLTLSVKTVQWFSHNKVFESLRMVLEYRRWNISSSIKLDPFYQEKDRNIKLNVRVKDAQLENIAVNLLVKDLVTRRPLPFALVIQGEYWDIDSGSDHGCPMKIVYG